MDRRNFIKSSLATRSDALFALSAFSAKTAASQETVPVLANSGRREREDAKYIRSHTCTRCRS
jgi:hypothetical protein